MKAIIALGVSFVALPAMAVSLQLLSQPDSSFAPSLSGGGDSTQPILSEDGRFVLFASTANNLAPATNNIPLQAPLYTCLNVYLRDRASNTTTLVSVNLAGTGGGDRDAWPAGISTNGQFALFESAAGSFVAGDTNNASDVFVRDLVNGTTILVSANTNGVGGNGDSSSSVMTPDGRYVAFTSAASDLVAGDTNGIPDVFVRDLQSGTTRRVSVGAMSTGSTTLANTSDSPAITPDATGNVNSSARAGDFLANHQAMTAPTTKMADKRRIPARERMKTELSMREISPILNRILCAVE